MNPAAVLNTALLPRYCLMSPLLRWVILGSLDSESVQSLLLQVGFAIQP